MPTFSLKVKCSIAFFLALRCPVAFADDSVQKKNKATEGTPHTDAVTTTLSAHAGDAEKGEKVFRDMQCFVCHEGGKNSIDPGKPIIGSKFEKRFSQDKQIEEVVRTGVLGTAMPAFSEDRLSNEEMKDLVCYVRSLSKKAKAKHKAGE